MISVVVPIFNEEESLETLHAELDRGFSPLGPVEFLFVDDGSRDRTWSVIAGLTQGDPRVRAIRLRRNFGKAAALSAGFRAARGDIVFTLDADLQDDPAEAPHFVAMLDQGLDVVSGWKKVRHDPWHKVWPSRVFNAAVSALTGCRLHDHNCGFKAYRRAALDEIEVYGELHRFVPVLAHSRGFRVGELPVHHRARRHGRSKYGVSRLLKGFLDLLTVRFLTGYGQRPLHPLGLLGLLLAALGLTGLSYLAIVWVRGEGPIGTRPLLGYSMAAIVVGVQLICLGILAELITSYHIRSHPPYSIAEEIDPAASDLPRPREAPVQDEVSAARAIDQEVHHG
jgi:glycosyltransferase involved in cell wall biosynthesis